MPRVHVVKRARPAKQTRKCRVCDHEIQPGEPYKWAKQRTGYPRYYSIWKFWCKDHSPSKYEFIQNPKVEARMRADDELMEALEGEFDRDAAEEAFNAAGDAIEELAEMERESAQNILDGFGHDTEMSQEFEERAEELQSAADNLRNADIPDEPDFEEPWGEADEPMEPSPMDYENGDGDEKYQEDLEEYESAYEDYQQDIEEYEQALEAWEKWRDEVRDLATELMGEAQL